MPQQKDLESLINLLETGLVVVNAQRQILLWNPWIARTTGIVESLALDHLLDDIFNKPIDPALISALEQASELNLSRRLSHQLHPALLPIFQKANGQPLYHSILVQPVTYKQQAACLLQISDVSSTVRREQHLRTAVEQVRHLAHHDTLTGLANRTLHAINLQKTCDSATKSQQPFALLFIDLDGFKSINDRFGHDAGDYLLQVTAQRLQKALVDFGSRAELVARLGGDEMVALLPKITNTDETLVFANHLCKLLEEPVEWQHQQMQVGASIGISLWPYQGLTPAALMTSADNAMYLAKTRGKGKAMLALNTP